MEVYFALLFNEFFFFCRSISRLVELSEFLTDEDEITHIFDKTPKSS